MSSRSASCFVAKPARGFQLLRIDGYSCSKDLPGSERVTSDVFTVGGRQWCVDYYPNGVDASVDESEAVALYLRLVGTASGGGLYDYYHHQIKERVRARYKFSLLDLATGDAAYERPEETGVFKVDWPQPAYGGAVAAGDGQAVTGGGNIGFGYAAFITREELEGLIREDRLAIRCDVGVTEVAPPPVVANNPSTASMAATPDLPLPPRNYSSYLARFNGGDEFDYLGGYRRNLEPPPVDDKEYIRRCLAGDGQINPETRVPPSIWLGHHASS